MGNPLPQDTLEAIIAASLATSEAAERLTELCDGIGGRPAGSEAGRRAEEWALETLRRQGLAAWTEPLPLLHWDRGPLDLRVDGPLGWPLDSVAHAYSPLAVDLSAELVDVGHGRAVDFAAAGEAVRGRIALCDEEVPAGERNPHRSERLAAAVTRGAAGLLILSSAAGGITRTGVCHRGLAPIPSLSVSREDGLRLRRLLARGGRPRLRLSMQNRAEPSEGRNVLADLPGRDPEAGLVLAGAHLDSWDLAQGAADNGLGSVIVLEIARVLGQLHASLAEERRPGATLRFALWTAEEIGLLGSTAYQRREAEAGGLARHRAVLNFDMTGNPEGYWLPGQAGAGATLAGLARQLAPLGMGPAVDHRAGLHSDHQAFMLAGVPVVALLAPLGPDGGRYYHSRGDTLDKIDLPALCRAVAVGAATLWALADETEPSLPWLSSEAVASMVDAAGLREALTALG